MKRKLSFIFSLLIMSLCFSLSIFAQETTGSIEVTVKDAQGAVVPNVPVTIADSGGSTTAFKRTVNTNDSGFIRVVQVPPGVYTVTAAATAGFQERVFGNITVNLGRATVLAIEMSTTVDATVNVSGSEVSPIDTTDTKIQTNITAQLADLLPKGPSFSSVLKVSPATRPEPRSGQFQIDGASGSENTFIIDGQEVTNVRTGTLDVNSNLPFSLIQEVQIKSSSAGAEYGGATGGVITLVTRAGNNEWHGEFGSQFRPSSLNAVSRPTLFRYSNGDVTYFQSQRDHYLEFNPSLNIGGPIIKDRAWFYASYSPQRFNQQRTIEYIDATDLHTTTYPAQTYKFRQINEYTFLKVDAQPFSKLRLTGTYNWNPIAIRGQIPGWTSSLFTRPAASNPCQAPSCQAGNPSLSGAAYVNQLGGRQNSQSVTGQAVYTPTSALALSFRMGHYFLNAKAGSYGIGDVSVPRVLCSNSSPQQFPAGFGCVRNQSNGVTAIENTLFDVTERDAWDADATYNVNFGGRHEFKGGVQSNGISNHVLLKDTDQIILRYGQPIGAYSQTGIPSSPTAVGSGSVVVYNEKGDVSSNNLGIFFQDKWQPTNRLSLTLGIRAEREDVPSFTPGAPGIKFDFQDKIAPRLGVSFDLTGKGKSVVKAFYGWFYDRFKYELPRGSFGGAIYHQVFYEIFPGDTINTFTMANIFGGSPPTPGGTCSGSLTPAYGRVRCDLDFRIASNTGLPLDEAGGIDPNIKAFRQSELTVSFEQELASKFLLAARYSRKKVDHTVEDAGFPNSQGSEFYIIGNPGEGLYKQIAEGFGLAALKPQRQYDAVEVRLDRRLADNYYFNMNYTWSRLWGNYSGLASSDEDGRLSPNVNRYFDQPHAGYTLTGGPDNGLLSTDRTHVFKFNGAYVLDWKRFFKSATGLSTDFLLFTTVQSGTPITSTVDLNNIDTIVVSKRGDAGRTAMFTQTDFAVRQRYHFGNDDRYTLIAEVDILNLFNEANETNRGNLITEAPLTTLDASTGLITQAQLDACGATNDYQPCYLTTYKNFQAHGSASLLATATDPANRSNLYNLANSFQGPRTVRFGFRFLF
jgi:hypothetical protein